MRGKLREFSLNVGQKSLLWLKIAILVVAGILPGLTFEDVEAAQLTSRSVTISTSEVNADDVEHDFSYTIPDTAGAKQGIVYDFCTAPLGTCITPTGLDLTGATHTSQTGWPNNATTAFARYTGVDLGDCVLTGGITYRLCFNRTEAGVGGGAVEHLIDGIDAPTVNGTVYIRITVYSDTSFATDLDQGVVAAAYVDQLTVTGLVQERLEFCVSAMRGGSTSPDSTPANCAGMVSTTEIAIGVIDGAAVYTTPVIQTATNQANERYGAAMVNTNASGGVSITYFAEEASSVSNSDTDKLRSFRVVPADCSPTVGSVTDQCFESASNTGEVISAGTEKFGMHIACIDGTQGTTTNNLTANINTAYDNDPGDSPTALDYVANCQETATQPAAEFGFDESGVPVQLVASDTVVDDEMLKIRFGATASATTPQGSYLVVLTYIATPTF